MIYKHVQDKGGVGDKRYLIAAQWWRKWCDYVNFEAASDDVTDDYNYERPGKITNKPLL